MIQGGRLFSHQRRFEQEEKITGGLGYFFGYLPTLTGREWIFSSGDGLASCSLLLFLADGGPFG